MVITLTSDRESCHSVTIKEKRNIDASMVLAAFIAAGHQKMVVRLLWHTIGSPEVASG